MEFSVVQGDIAKREADALVNAANTELEMGAGVAGALREAGGEELNDEAVSKGPIGLGEAVETDAYDLDADYVIHAAAMRPGGEATAVSIRGAVQNAVERADELGCESVVVPLVGTGVAGFSVEEGGRIVCEVLDDHEPESLTDVRLVAYTDQDYSTVEQISREVRG